MQKTGFRTAVAFSARLRDETELDTLSGDVVDLVREATTGGRGAGGPPLPLLTRPGQ